MTGSMVFSFICLAIVVLGVYYLAWYRGWKAGFVDSNRCIDATLQMAMYLTKKGVKITRGPGGTEVDKDDEAKKEDSPL